MNFEIDSDV